jgi:hypothetical protein
MDHRELIAIRGCLELSIMMTSALCGLQNFRVSGYDINAADGILFAVNTNGLAVVRAAVIGRKRKAADTECALCELSMTLRCNIGDVELLVADDWQVISRENLTTKLKARLTGINWRCWICVHDLVRLEITVLLQTV